MTLFKYIKFLFQIVLMVIVTIADSLFVIYSTIFRVKSYNFFKHYKNWASRILFIGGIKLTVIGEDNIKDGETYIFASNHASQFDIPIIFKAIKCEIRIIYKKELEKVFLFGWQLKKSPFIAVERDDPRKSMKSIEEAAAYIRKNINVIIFPEGTRSVDGKVAEFKRGAFLLASKSGKPILPVTIIGSNAIMPKGKLYFEPMSVIVKIHPPVYYPADLGKVEEKLLMEGVRNTIISGFEN